jgi:predicted AlkP superfamily phosphohydrolase/phosphomutase
MKKIIENNKRRLHRGVFAIVLCAFVCAGAGAYSPAPANEEMPRVFVLGIDGMDPKLLAKYISKGRMPNFETFVRENTFSDLGTSIPPQSPVAWASFITGTDPGSHGIYDFIHRSTEDYFPVFSASSVTPPEKTLKIGSWVLPLSGGEAINLMRGKTFWQSLDDHDIPYTIFRIPSNFPPTPCEGVSISGMGTPDLLGTYGTFSFFTDDPAFPPTSVSGGEMFQVAVENNRVTAEIIGPENTMKEDTPELKRSFTVDLDPENRSAKITIGDEVLLLDEGEWSDWVPVKFDLLGPIKSVPGMCLMYLKQVTPHFQLYVSPINIDPSNPALPISTPSEFSKDLYKRIGRFYTQGMPEDTKALESGVFSDGEFLRQTDIVLSERMKMLDAMLEDFKEGLMFFYVSTLDQGCHMLWKNMDPNHPNHPEDHAHQNAIENLYAKMDSLLGVVQEHLPDNTTLMIMSDHGFAPFYKKFNINTWLYQNGFLEIRDPRILGELPAHSNTNWRKTRAYAMGINSIYINLRGRESRGIVSQKDYDKVLDELEEKLLAVRDPETGDPVVKTLYRTRDIFHGDALADAPDAVVGYYAKYRCNDQSALGQLSEEVFTVNMSKWSGDHCMEHTEVPGVLLVNRPIVIDDPDLRDLPVSILALYGIEKPEVMTGRSVFGDLRTASK